MEEETEQFIESYKIRKKVVAFLKRFEWVILISLTVTSWVLGFIGFWIYFQEIEEVRTISDIAYVTFQLFTFESGFVDNHAPLILDIARFLAPFTLAYAAFIAFMWFIEQKYKLLKLKRFSDHTVIIGLGKSGIQLLKNMQKEDKKIVVVTKEELAPADRSDHMNTIFISKNIKDDGVLEQIRIGDAKYVMCMTDNEQENLSAGNLVSDFPSVKLPENKTKIFIQARPFLIEQLQDLDFDDKASNNYKIFGHKINYFSIYDRAARLIVQEYAPDKNFPSDFLKNSKIQAHILIAGFEALGQALLLQAGRLYHFANRNKLKATVIYNHIEEVEQFTKTYPEVEKVIDLNFFPLNEINKRNIHKKTELSKIHTIYICSIDETEAIEAYNKVSLLMPKTELVFCHENPDDFSERINRAKHFNLNDTVLKIDTIVKENIDKQAMLIHQSYQFEENSNNDEKSKKLKEMTRQEWKKLPERTKNQNRNQAEHIDIKLRAADCKANPETNIDMELLYDFESDRKMLEILAEVEHRRWNAEQHLNGWIQGERNNELKIHNNIVPYSILDESTKQYDRNAVINIPLLLSNIGLKVKKKAVKHD